MYVHRKGWPCIILLAFVDDHLLLREVRVGTPGSAHDAAVCYAVCTLWSLRYRFIDIIILEKNTLGYIQANTSNTAILLGLFILLLII